MKKISTKIGTIITWYDYIKAKKNINTGITEYSQSNTKLDKYSQRYVGLYLSDNNDIYVAVAVNKKDDSSNWWRYILENRITTMVKNRGNVNPEDKGCTMVPMSYKDLLFMDVMAYSSLYGMIDPSILDMALKEATSSNEDKINAYSARVRQSSKETA
jgi:hypothetical protein